MRAKIYTTMMLVAVGSWTVAANASPNRSEDPRACLGTSVAADHRVVDIPDADERGVDLGPLTAESNGSSPMIVAVTIQHAYAGDIAIELGYDADRDGSIDATTTLDIHLARIEACGDQPMWACPVELDGTYYFEDNGWARAGETASLAQFKDLEPGGFYHLTVRDTAAHNTGVVERWSIYSGGQEVEDSSYGGSQEFGDLCLACAHAGP